MQTLRHLLVLLAIFAGISAKEQPLKKKLLSQLKSYNASSEEWIAYYGNQSFNHYVNVLKNYQQELMNVYTMIAQLKESSVAANGISLSKIVNETITSIDFENPDPHEDLKLSALYSAIQHQSLRGENFTEYVIYNISNIIQKENELKTANTSFVNTIGQMELKNMYAKLEDMISGYYIPKRTDFLKLANDTQMNIDAMIEDGYDAEAFKINLKEYNDLTRVLARDLPLHSIEMIRNYFAIVKKHYSTGEVLNKVRSYNGQYRDRLLYRLNACENTLDAVRTDFIDRGNTYFANCIDEVITRVKYALKHAEELPIYTSRDETVDLLFDEVKALEATTASVVVNPAPEQSLLAGAIYLAVERMVRPMQDNYNINASEIIKKAKLIVKQENALKVGTLAPSFNKSDVAILQVSIEKLFKELRQLISGHDLPTFADNDKLIDKTIAKIAEMSQRNMKDVAGSFQYQLDMLQEQTVQLYKIFPLNNEERIDSFITIAREHYFAVTTLRYLFTKYDDDTPKTETDNKKL